MKQNPQEIYYFCTIFCVVPSNEKNTENVTSMYASKSSVLRQFDEVPRHLVRIAFMYAARALHPNALKRIRTEKERKKSVRGRKGENEAAADFSLPLDPLVPSRVEVGDEAGLTKVSNICFGYVGKYDTIQ